jgi:hypothetical protein
MMEVTGETFSEAMLSVSRNRDEYFDKNGEYLFLLTLVITITNIALCSRKASSD